MAPSLVVVVVAVFVGLVALFVEELVTGAIWSALTPELTRSLDILTSGYGALVVGIVETLFFVALMYAVFEIVFKRR